MVLPIFQFLVYALPNRMMTSPYKPKIHNSNRFARPHQPSRCQDNQEMKLKIQRDKEERKEERKKRRKERRKEEKEEERKKGRKEERKKDRKRRHEENRKEGWKKKDMT